MFMSRKTRHPFMSMPMCGLHSTLISKRNIKYQFISSDLTNFVSTYFFFISNELLVYCKYNVCYYKFGVTCQ